jgi:ribosomal protein S18 acetylase RimI-like enzyme
MPSRINVGPIKKDKNLPFQREVRYEIRFMDETHLIDIIDLQEIIVHFLADKEIFRTQSIDYFKEHLQMPSAALGAFTDDGLIAYSVLYFPGEGEDNFGADINLSKDELDRVVHLATVAVHPAYRGNSLQSKMQGLHLEVAQKMGYEHACCMVSPKNHTSLRNIFSIGLIIKALKIKFGWRLRYIMHRSLSNPCIIGPEEIRIKSSDTEGQIALLNRGLLGFRAVDLPNGLEVSYGRACTPLA